MSAFPLAVSGGMYAAEPIAGVVTGGGAGIDLRQTEAEHLERAVRREHEVGGFQVAVQDVAVVGMLQERGRPGPRPTIPRARAAARFQHLCAKSSPSTNSQATNARPPCSAAVEEPGDVA